MTKTAKPTLVVRINWSESNLVNKSGLIDGDFHDIKKVNKLLRKAADLVVARDGGYDKTNFTLMVWDGSDEDLSEYTGRMDLGKEQNGYGLKLVENHIKDACTYYTSERCPEYMRSTGKEADELRWWIKVVA